MGHIDLETLRAYPNGAPCWTDTWVWARKVLGILPRWACHIAAVGKTPGRSKYWAELEGWIVVMKMLWKEGACWWKRPESSEEWYMV